MFRKTMGCLSRLILLLVVLAIGVTVWAFVEPYMLRIREDTLTYDTLPEAFSGLRVAYLSDIHWGRNFSDKRVAELVGKVNALQPDIILLGGDYAEVSEGAVTFFQKKPGFSAPFGVYAIPGNHDRTPPERNRALLIDAMWQAGVTPLFNAVIPVQKDGQFIYLAGLDDLKTGYPDVEGVAGSLFREDFVILLSHDPDSLQGILASGDGHDQRGWADLILCGHTHGGQVNLGPYSPFLSRVVRDQVYRYGLFHEGGSDILVTSGIGTAVVPMRLGARPEICLITLNRGQRI